VALLCRDEFGGERGDLAAIGDRIDAAVPDQTSELLFEARRSRRDRIPAVG
jgi:hypothetical protein